MPLLHYLCLIAVLLIACSDPAPPPGTGADTSEPTTDSATVPTDTSAPGADTKGPAEDGAVPTVDTETTEPDGVTDTADTLTPSADVSLDSGGEETVTPEDTSAAPDITPEDTTPAPPAPETEGYRIGYYTNWSQYRPAPRQFFPSDIDPTLYTHIMYAFADIIYDGNPGKDAKSFSIAPLEWNDIKDWTVGVAWTDPQGHMMDVINLKKVNPDLKVLISLGGWNFNDPAWTPLLPHHQSVSTAWIFSRIVELPEERAHFIKSVLDFCADYGFDGVDLDWEYPGIAAHNCVAGTGICEKNDDGTFKDRAIDKPNFALFLAELRAAADEDPRFDKFWITIAVGAYEASATYYDYDAIPKSVDWIGLMTYDFHGAWHLYTGAMVPTGEDSVPGGEFSIAGSLQLHACPKKGDPPSSQAVADLCADFEHPTGGFGIPAEKLVMGFATYGRGWSGVDEPGFNVPASGPSPAGAFTKQPGLLGYYEIQELLSQGDALGNAYTAYFDDATQTPYIYSATAKVLVSYDNAEGYMAKLKLLAKLGLAGAMVWSMDTDLFLESDVPQNELQKVLHTFFTQ